MKLILIPLLLSLTSSFCLADAAPEPFLKAIDLPEGNLQQIYSLIPSKEVAVTGAMTEKGAKLYRKILRNGPKVDDVAHRRWPTTALICERREYSGNSNALPFNKFSCREVLAFQMNIPAKDEDLVRLKNE